MLLLLWSLPRGTVTPQLRDADNDLATAMPTILLNIDHKSLLRFWETILTISVLHATIENPIFNVLKNKSKDYKK